MRRFRVHISNNGLSVVINVFIICRLVIIPTCRQTWSNRFDSESDCSVSLSFVVQNVE